MHPDCAVPFAEWSQQWVMENGTNVWNGTCEARTCQLGGSWLRPAALNARCPGRAAGGEGGGDCGPHIIASHQLPRASAALPAPRWPRWHCGHALALAGTAAVCLTAVPLPAVPPAD